VNEKRDPHSFSSVDFTKKLRAWDAIPIDKVFHPRCLLMSAAGRLAENTNV